MLFASILLCGLITVVLSITSLDLVNSMKDFWIVILAFIVGVLIGIILIVLTILIGAIFVSNKKTYDKPKKYYYNYVTRVTELLLLVSGCRVYIRGLDKLPLDKKYLLIANHQSMFDSIALVWTMRGFTTSFVHKNGLLKLPIVGRYLNASSFISIDRENPREGVKAINKAADKIINNVSSVVICPEGTRSKSYQVGEFHHGSFKIALKAKCPIILCAIQNGCKVKSRFPFKTTKIYIDFVEVMNYDDFKEKSTQDISDYAYNQIKEALNELPKY